MALRLLSRVDCHLCEDVAEDLTRLGIGFETLDVDMDAALQRQYGDDVPVLLDDDREIARAPLTATSLTAALRKAGLLAESKR